MAASIDQAAITTESFVIAEAVTELNFRNATTTSVVHLINQMFMYHLNIFVSYLPSDTTKKEFKVAVDLFVPIDGCKLFKGRAKSCFEEKKDVLDA